MERVSIVHGKNPVILIAPHGHDDTYSGDLAKFAAIECKGNAILNNGWERSKSVDVANSLANCNDINHVMHDVVKDEFFDPIARKEKELLRKHKQVLVFHIHGCGNHIAQLSGISDLDVVIGVGKGPKGKSRPVCSNYYLNLFYYMILVCTKTQKSWTPAIAEAGSRFAGWDSNNLLQMWRSPHQFSGVQSMQLEFLTKKRISKKTAETTGKELGNIISQFLAFVKTNSVISPGTILINKITI